MRRSFCGPLFGPRGFRASPFGSHCGSGYCPTVSLYHRFLWPIGPEVGGFTPVGALEMPVLPGAVQYPPPQPSDYPSGLHPVALPRAPVASH